MKSLIRKAWNRIAKDNSGAGIVMVIVAIGLVSVLVSVILSVTLLNYQMKITERKSKENFYTAEEALDQIRAGLQIVVSDAANVAYLGAMQQYKDGTSTELERVQNFRNKYMASIKEALQEPSNDTHYLLGTDASNFDDTTKLFKSGLASYLYPSYAQALFLDPDREAQYGVLTLSCDLLDGKSAEEAANTKTMILTTEGVILKGVKVSYTDPSGFYSEIVTDIQLGFPDISLKESTVLPYVFDYSLIGNDSIVFNGSPSVKVTSNIYAGDNGIELKSGAKVSVTDSTYLVSAGDITIPKTTELDIKNESVYAKGFRVEGSGISGDTSSSSAVLDAKSDFFMADDLSLFGKNVSVQLKGNYYGFGMGSKVDAQSAILMNSANSTLNLTGLDTLLLGGSAYLNEKNYDPLNSEADENGYVENKSPVLLGTSLAAKTDQIAFLAPAEILGTVGGATVIGRNPMSEEEYDEWINGKNTYGDDYVLFDVNMPISSPNLGNPLYMYNLSYNINQPTNSSYEKVVKYFRGEPVIYIYLKFATAADAAAYYKDYIAAAKDRFNAYLKRYNNNILINQASLDTAINGETLFYNGDEKMQSAGSLLYYAISSDTMAIVNNNSTEAMADLEDKLVGYSNYYNGLCTKLTINYVGLTKAEKNNPDVYSNIINSDAVNALTETMTYTYSLEDGSKTYEAKIVNNAGGSTFKVGSNSANTNVKLVIASGDVEVSGNFSGLIISNGIVTVDNSTGTVISSDASNVTHLLQLLTPESSNMKTVIATYFLNGERYSTKGVQEDENAFVSLDRVITYVNWTKQ